MTWHSRCKKLICFLSEPLIAEFESGPALKLFQGTYFISPSSNLYLALLNWMFWAFHFRCVLSTSFRPKSHEFVLCWWDGNFYHTIGKTFKSCVNRWKTIVLCQPRCSNKVLWPNLLDFKGLPNTRNISQHCCALLDQVWKWSNFSRNIFVVLVSLVHAH